jgi:hypothetical protein
MGDGADLVEARRTYGLARASEHGTFACRRSTLTESRLLSQNKERRRRASASPGARPAVRTSGGAPRVSDIHVDDERDEADADDGDRPRARPPLAWWCGEVSASHVQSETAADTLIDGPWTTSTPVAWRMSPASSPMANPRRSRALPVDEEDQGVAKALWRLSFPPGSDRRIAAGIMPPARKHSRPVRTSSA